MNEQSKYESMWTHEGYRAVAPGEHHVREFINLAKPSGRHTIADFGCGTGRGALLLRALTNCSVTSIDFASNCLDDDVSASLSETFRFRQHDLTKRLDERYDFGFCTDVLEHIPPESLDAVITNIAVAARNVYFAISTEPDHMGALIGEPLHLSVHDAYWWHTKLTDLGFRVDWSAMGEGVVAFYGSGFMNAEDILDIAVLNMENQKVQENIRANLSLGLREVEPYSAQEQVVYLLAGGPSLADFETQIIEAGRDGTPIVTVNGTYGWLLERGIKPAAQIMVDGRSFNKRFVERTVDSCKYLISSQCDTELVRSLPKEQTWLWHSGGTPIVEDMLRELCHECYPVHGGTTVVTRALVLLAMLGFRNIEVFGFDSCLRDGEHHAYAQPENDDRIVIETTVGDRTFRCHGWMVIQADDFRKTVRHVLGLIPDFNLIVHGDGMIAHMLNHSAALAASKEATNGC